MKKDNEGVYMSFDSIEEAQEYADTHEGCELIIDPIVRIGKWTEPLEDYVMKEDK